MADFVFEDTKQPQGFSWSKFKVAVEGDRAQLTIPGLVTWGKNLSEPEVDDQDRKKWSIGLAIPKSADAGLLMERIRDAEQAVARAAGVKGAFPSAFRDGDAKDSSGMYVKSRGSLAGFWYFTAKTRKTPRVIERGDGGEFLEYDAAAVNGGGYVMLSTSMIVIGHGSDTKKGTSLWFDKVLWLGGGNQFTSASSGSDDDAFGDLIGGSAGAGASAGNASSFI